LAWAHKLAGQAPIAIEEIKKRSHHPDLDEGLAGEAEGFGRAFGSEDAKEGISAFIGKRKPSFKGR
jgi:enoyl-CoA hydratase/carnithine racemase